MKIITPGTIPEKWWVGLNVTCTACSAVLQFTEADTPGQVFNPNEADANKVYSRCPLCGTRVELQFSQESNRQP